MDNSKDLTTFIREDLYPSLFPKLDLVFPEMKFQKLGKKWISPNYLDGTPTKGQNYRKDKTFVSSNRINLIKEQGGQFLDLLTFFMNQNSVSNVFEAVKEICKIISIPPPPETEEQKEKARLAKERQEIIDLSYERQKKALFSPEGAEVLEYLTQKRGYSPELIRKMGLGYLSPKEGAFLEEKTKIGYYNSFADFTLSIPYYSKGRLQGFKLRKPKKGEKDKYRNTANLTGLMKTNPFGLAPWNVTNGTEKERTLIVVEGELDALHAIAAGGENIIATAGSDGVTAEMAIELKKSGYSTVILTLDTDETGQDYTEKNIANLESCGIKAYVAKLPEGKDTDEYLTIHKDNIEDFKQVLKGCFPAVYFLFWREAAKYNATPKTRIDFDKFTDKVIELSLKTNNEILRGRILDSLRVTFGISGEEAYKGFRERADRLKAEQERQKALTNSDTALKEANGLLSQGNSKAATEKAREALEQLKKAGGEDNLSFLLRDNTEELWKRYRNPSKTLDSGYIFWKNKKNDPEDFQKLTFPAGGISVIGAATGHGKSKMLQSLTLDALEAKWEKGIILYITYEENEEQVNEQFLNALANVQLTKRGGNAQLRIIDDYLRSGDPSVLDEGTPPKKNAPRYDSGEKSNREKFLEAEKRWIDIRKSDRIRILKPEDNYLETLMDILNYAKEHLPLRAVFIDYIQELYIEDFKKMRTDELKEIMVELDLFAQNTRLPIIAGAQLKRETASPADLFNNMMDSSGWIERKASEIVLIWSSQHEIRKEELKKIKDVIPEAEEAAPFMARQEGKLFLKVTKSRLIPVGSTAIVRINGRTGRVEANGNLPIEPEKKPEDMYSRNNLQRVEESREEPHKAEPLPFDPPSYDEELPF